MIKSEELTLQLNGVDFDYTIDYSTYETAEGISYELHELSLYLDGEEYDESHKINELEDVLINELEIKRTDTLERDLEKLNERF